MENNFSINYFVMCLSDYSRIIVYYRKVIFLEILICYLSTYSLSICLFIYLLLSTYSLFELSFSVLIRFIFNYLEIII